MLLSIAAMLGSLWYIGAASAYTLGGFIHILLVGALIIILARIIRGGDQMRHTEFLEGDVHK